MQCFRCNNKDFDVLKPSLFGLAVIECYHCKQQFFIKEKLELAPIELLGEYADIEVECIIKKCNFCDTKRYIAVDCTHLNMQSCGFCNLETVPVGDKIPFSEFISSPSIDGDA
jgi:hypothetical protein